MTSEAHVIDVGHREFREDEFWREIPGWQGVSAAEFADHTWQSRNSVTKIKQVKQLLGDRISASFIEDLIAGQVRTPMNIRITP